MKFATFICILFCLGKVVTGGKVREKREGYGLTCEVGRFEKGDHWDFDFNTETCDPNYDACETKLEVHADRHIVTKSCGHLTSCTANAETNTSRCDPAADPGNGNFLCFYCCTSNNCNYYELLVEDDHTSEVIFKRNGTISFDRDWAAYRVGFGDPRYEFFVGLEYLYEVTSYYQSCTLTICYDNCVSTAVTYTDFAIGSEYTDYEMTFSTTRTHTGRRTAREFFALRRRNLPVKFSTYDDDNDSSMSNCADEVNGGWWYYDTCSGSTATWSLMRRNYIEFSLDCSGPLMR